MMYEAREDDKEYVKLEKYDVPDLERPTFKEATAKDITYKPSHKWDSFGPSWSTHWIKITMKVPKKLLKADLLEFHWDCGNEGLIWTEDGVPLQGLTGGDRIEWIIPSSFKDGEEHVFYIEMACNGMFGNAVGDSIQPPDPNRYFQLSKADIVSINVAARALFVDFWIIGDAAREFPDDSPQAHEAQQIANAIVDVFEISGGTQKSIEEGRSIAEKYIGTKVNSEKVYDNDKAVTVYAIGHCHIGKHIPLRCIIVKC
jgi:alpha-mannosidase